MAKKKTNPHCLEVTIEKDGDGSFIAYNTEDSKYSIVGRGESVDGARVAFMESLQEMVAYEQKQGSVNDLLTAEPVFKFDISSLFEYYSIINVSAFARYIGINESLMRQYKKGGVYISDAQLTRIESGIHRIGQEFSSLKLV